MKWNMQKYIDEYKRKFYTDTGNAAESKDVFHVSDVYELRDISRLPDGTDSLYNAICNSLNAGFMVGYNYHRRETKRIAKVRI